MGGNYNLNEIADRFAEKLEVLEEEEIAEQKKLMEANPNAFTIYEGSSNPSEVSQNYSLNISPQTKQKNGKTYRW